MKMMKGSGLKNSHPAVGFCYFLSVFILSLSMSHPAVAVSSLFAAAVYDRYLKGKKAAKGIALAVIPVLIFVPLINGLFSHYGVTVLFVMKSGNNFTLEAVLYGLFLAVKFLSVMLWLDCFNEIIDGDKFVYLFGRFSPRLALVISMTLRFIPMLRDGYAEVENAGRGIGLSGTEKNLLKKFKASAHKLSVLVTWVLENAIDTSYSMKARGYAVKRRSAYSKFVFTVYDGLSAAATGILFGLSCFAVFGLKALYNPIIEIERFGLLDVLSFAAFLLLCLFPYALDLREKSLVKPYKERKPDGYLMYG
ncbi:MAG: energy-coupling factor transporter transmembrane component T [Acutalibacteraceae bacterium]